MCGESEKAKAVEEHLNTIQPDGFRVNYTERYIYLITWEDGKSVKAPKKLCICDDSMLSSDNVHCINCQGIIINK
jgi:hypothetical protein